MTGQRSVQRTACKMSDTMYNIWQTLRWYSAGELGGTQAAKIGTVPSRWILRGTCAFEAIG